MGAFMRGIEALRTEGVEGRAGPGGLHPSRSPKSSADAVRGCGISVQAIHCVSRRDGRLDGRSHT